MFLGLPVLVTQTLTAAPQILVSERYCNTLGRTTGGSPYRKRLEFLLKFGIGIFLEYIDGATGSYFLAMLAGGAAGMWYAAKIAIRKLLRRKTRDELPETTE
jgi:hypothetical protein